LFVSPLEGRFLLCQLLLLNGDHRRLLGQQCILRSDERLQLLGALLQSLEPT
jgi:hypothetical protein